MIMYWAVVSGWQHCGYVEAHFGDYSVTKQKSIFWYIPSFLPSSSLSFDWPRCVVGYVPRQPATFMSGRGCQDGTYWRRGFVAGHIVPVGAFDRGTIGETLKLLNLWFRNRTSGHVWVMYKIQFWFGCSKLSFRDVKHMQPESGCTLGWYRLVIGVWLPVGLISAGYIVTPRWVVVAAKLSFLVHYMLTVLYCGHDVFGLIYAFSVRVPCALLRCVFTARKPSVAC
jgi:hypothetical protein